MSHHSQHTKWLPFQARPEYSVATLRLASHARPLVLSLSLHDTPAKCHPPTGRSRAAFPDPPSTDHVPSPAGLPLRCRDSVILTLPGQLLESSPFAVDQTLARRVLFAFCLEHHKQSRGRIRSTVGRPRPVRVQSRAEFATKPDRLFSLDFHTWQTHAHLAPVLTQWIPCFISYRQILHWTDRPTELLHRGCDAASLSATKHFHQQSLSATGIFPPDFRILAVPALVQHESYPL